MIISRNLSSVKQSLSKNQRGMGKMGTGKKTLKKSSVVYKNIVENSSICLKIQTIVNMLLLLEKHLKITCKSGH